MSKSSSIGSPQRMKVSKQTKKMSVNDQLDALRTRDDEALFYNKVSNLLDNIMERVKNTEEKLSIAEQNKVEKSLSSIKRENSENRQKNPFKIPDISSECEEPIEHIIQTPKRKLIKRPVRQPSMSEIMDALTLLQMEIAELKENQDDMEKQIVQIHKLID